MCGAEHCLPPGVTSVYVDRGVLTCNTALVATVQRLWQYGITCYLPAAANRSGVTVLQTVLEEAVLGNMVIKSLESYLATQTNVGFLEFY